RPPGREAYPGDVFYLHSRLLERAAKLSDEYGGGSITALPIIETQAGDVSAYIPTNVISITDGQIFLESDLFNAGQRPAVNAGISVSRVGGSAQRRAMRSVAGQLRIDMAQFRELQAFAQFGTSDLDAATRRQLERGQRLSALLVQPEQQPLAMSTQVALLYAANSGVLDDVPVNKVNDFAIGASDYLNTSHRDLLGGIADSGQLSDDDEAALSSALQTFKDTVPF
ncbi:MAG: F0F1 ATP synthase subunit alpha, partial [Chloroflexi bacterium]|nr:F0F1 ATP synthase subunit alpha [Chloroflexota bacterium]